MRIITWFKKHQYQWVREDFRKVSDRLFWGSAISILCLYGSVVVMAKVNAGAVVLAIVVAVLFAVIGGSWASAFAIQWADKKLKGR